MIKSKQISTIYLILLFFILACTAEAGKAKTYIYTVKNESGVKIKILGYPKFSPNESSYPSFIHWSETN